MLYLLGVEVSFVGCNVNVSSPNLLNAVPAALKISPT